MEKQILLAHTFKDFRNGNGFNRCMTFVSYDIDKLKEKIENFYKIKLVKNDEDNFPYFTDGGFRYKCETESFIFETEAFLYDIIE